MREKGGTSEKKRGRNWNRMLKGALSCRDDAALRACQGEEQPPRLREEGEDGHGKKRGLASTDKVRSRSEKRGQCSGIADSCKKKGDWQGGRTCN